MRKEIDKKKNVTQVKWNSKNITCIPEVFKKNMSWLIMVHIFLRVCKKLLLH